MEYIARELTVVTAWKYEAGQNIPVWVAKKCHFLGDGKLTANTIIGPIPVSAGDYIVKADLAEADDNVVVVDGAQFEREYMPKPE